MTRESYPDSLRLAWDAHKAPRTADAPTVVSLFAGCGGSSLGYSMAGYRELLAVEWENHSAETFRRNFPEVPLHHGDIAHVDASTLNLAPGELDVLDGSPPCQGFSAMGKRELDDPRNFLFREYVRLLTLWRPRVLVMENVPGLARGEMRAVYAEIMEAFADAGYIVTARLIDCSLLGVPQKRVRLVFVGVRKDLGIEPAHPKPLGRLPLTFRDATADLPEQSGPAPTGKRAKLAAHLVGGENGADVLERAGYKRTHFSVVKLHADRPANTLTKAAHGDLLHPSGRRFLSVRELERLQSFPDEFDWGDSSPSQVSARIGNSVPPLMMRAVAEAIRARILAQAITDRNPTP